jgi:hypothetical protein
MNLQFFHKLVLWSGSNRAWTDASSSWTLALVHNRFELIQTYLNSKQNVSSSDTWILVSIHNNYGPFELMQNMSFELVHECLNKFKGRFLAFCFLLPFCESVHAFPMNECICRKTLIFALLSMLFISSVNNIKQNTTHNFLSIFSQWNFGEKHQDLKHTHFASSSSSTFNIHNFGEEE